MSLEEEYINRKSNELYKFLLEGNYIKKRSIIPYFKNKYIHSKSLHDFYDKYVYNTIINRNTCKSCITPCCAQTPCSFLPWDFNDIHDFDYMKNILETGLVRVKGEDEYSLGPSGEKDDSVVYCTDIENRCVLFNSNGCMLEKYYRPSMALLFIPSHMGLSRCNQIYNGLLSNDYMPYQDDLKKLKEISDECALDRPATEEEVKTLVKKIVGYRK